MTRLCLDTSAYSHFRRGDAEAVRAITSAASVIVPTPTLGELRAGFALGNRRAENEAALRSFLSEPIVSVGEIDDAASALYAEIVVELRTRGTPVPTNDMWIAAVAIRDGATVLTYDEHFTRIRRAGVQVLARA